MSPDNGSLSYHKLHGSDKKGSCPLLRSHSPGARWASPGMGTAAAPGVPEGGRWRRCSFQNTASSSPFPCPLKAHFLCSSTALQVSASPEHRRLSIPACCSTPVLLQPVLTVAGIAEKQLLVQKQEGFSFFCSHGEGPFHSLFLLPGSRLGAFCI